MIRRLAPFALALLVGLVVAGGSLAVDSERGLRMLVDLSLAVEERETRVAGLERERTRLRTHIRALKNDPLELESVARRRLGMVRPGELVIRWDVDAPPVAR